MQNHFSEDRVIETEDRVEEIRGQEMNAIQPGNVLIERPGNEIPKVNGKHAPDDEDEDTEEDDLILGDDEVEGDEEEFEIELEEDMDEADLDEDDLVLDTDDETEDDAEEDDL
jgi:hypothetical protein